MTWAVVATPIGPVGVSVTGAKVSGVDLTPGDQTQMEEPTGLLAEAVEQLSGYFAGTRTDFVLPLSVPQGGSSGFERAVWRELTRIPYGETRTYGEVAAAVGDAGAARAIGTACHRNPLPVIVPCHRVVGAGGKLVGFGGGLPRKRWLLEHEARFALERLWGWSDSSADS